jgi:hypothetical protein
MVRIFGHIAKKPEFRNCCCKQKARNVKNVQLQKLNSFNSCKRGFFKRGKRRMEVKGKGKVKMSQSVIPTFVERPGEEIRVAGPHVEIRTEHLWNTDAYRFLAHLYIGMHSYSSSSTHSSAIFTMMTSLENVISLLD